MRFQLKKRATLRALGRIGIALIVLGIPSLCYAQQSPLSPLISTPLSASSVAQQDDPVLKALNEMTARAIAAESKNELYEARLKDKDQIIEAWKGRAEISEKQLALSGRIDVNSQQIQSIDQFRVEACQQQLSKADAEINRLRHPGFLRSVFDARTLTGAMVGFGIGRLNK